MYTPIGWLRVASAVLALSLGACATGGATWYKKGASAAQLRADRRYCEAQAGGYDYLHPGQRATPRVGGRSQAELYRWCMRDLGYRRRARGAS